MGGKEKNIIFISLMVKTLKYILLYIGIALITIICACKKNEPIQNHITNHQFDFRDSLVGTYNASNHSYTTILQDSLGQGIWVTTSAISPNMHLYATKSFGTDSSIIVNGNTFAYVNTSNGKFNFLCTSCASGSLSFGVNNDSIWSLVYTRMQIDNQAYSYYAGHK